MTRIDQLLQHDTWASADGGPDEAPFLIRFRTPIIEPGEAPTYDRRLCVVWAYAEEGSGAMPDEAESEAMAEFENRLCAAWEQDALAFLSAVVTYDGARQWVWYVRDVAQCGERLEEMPQEAEPYPIELTTAHDPDWNFLREETLANVDWSAQQAEWKAAFDERS